jgi:hemoglobin
MMRALRVSLLGFVVVHALAVAGCASAPVTVATNPVAAAAPEPVKPKSLYERLGGQPALVVVVDDMVGFIAADARVQHYFVLSDIPLLKRRLVEFVCVATGGPCTYTGRNMTDSHKNMRVDEGAWNAVVEDLIKALDKNHVPAQEKGELLGALGPLKPSIVDPG